jgi:hyperosmotically inducible periplasmic protein
MKQFKVMCLSALILAATALVATSLPLSASDMDGRIESSARASYIFQTYLQGDDIKVESKDGIVTLTGTVASDSHRSMAQETVTDLPGVKAVDNKLELKGEPPTPNSDLWIGDKVKTTLLFHRSVSALNTEVDVKEGVVTLRGVASSNAEKELATEYVKDVDGVKGVENHMTIGPAPEKSHRTAGEKMDDASITAQVKMALLFHSSTSAIRTEVKTKLGLVTVQGKAHSDAEKHLVTKIAEDVNGVVGVKNEMTIENDD